MDKKELFWWLVHHHINVDLERCLPHIVDGRLRNRAGETYTVGISEVEPELHSGVLLVADGEKLARSLVNKRIALSELGQEEVLGSKEDLTPYLLEQGERDGAYVANSAKSTIRRVKQLRNDFPERRSMGQRLSNLVDRLRGIEVTPELGLYDRVPVDFQSYDQSVEREEMGTKTRLAIKIPRAYPNTDTFQIRATTYTPLGTGKVTHFDERGLVEEFFMMYAPSSKGPFILKKEGIVGVYRAYDRKDGKLIRVEEKLLDLGTPLMYFGHQDKRAA